MNEEPRNEEEQVEDLDVGQEISEDVKGGRKAGKGQQEFLTYKLDDAQISNYQTGG